MDSPATKVIYRNSAPIFQSDGGGGGVALESYSIIALARRRRMMMMMMIVIAPGNEGVWLQCSSVV